MQTPSKRSALLAYSKVAKQSSPPELSRRHRRRHRRPGPMYPWGRRPRPPGSALLVHRCRCRRPERPRHRDRPCRAHQHQPGKVSEPQGHQRRPPRRCQRGMPAGHTASSFGVSRLLSAEQHESASMSPSGTAARQRNSDGWNASCATCVQYETNMHGSGRLSSQHVAFVVGMAPTSPARSASSHPQRPCRGPAWFTTRQLSKPFTGMCPLPSPQPHVLLRICKASHTRVGNSHQHTLRACTFLHGKHQSRRTSPARSVTTTGPFVPSTLSPRASSAWQLPAPTTEPMDRRLLVRPRGVALPCC